MVGSIRSPSPMYEPQSPKKMRDEDLSPAYESSSPCDADESRLLDEAREPRSGKVHAPRREPPFSAWPGSSHSAVRIMPKVSTFNALAVDNTPTHFCTAVDMNLASHGIKAKTVCKSSLDENMEHLAKIMGRPVTLSFATPSGMATAVGIPSSMDSSREVKASQESSAPVPDTRATPPRTAHSEQHSGYRDKP